MSENISDDDLTSPPDSDIIAADDATDVPESEIESVGTTTQVGTLMARSWSIEDDVLDCSASVRQTSQRFSPSHSEVLQQEVVKSCDVVFVGAGPCGLWTAVQLIIRCPHLVIVMLEKHATYQRRHVVQLLQRSMNKRPKKGPGAEELNKLCSSLPVFVRTNELEDKLTALAIKLGIHVIIESVEDVQRDVVEKYHPRVVVGSDGSHSIVRTTFMTHEPKLSTDKVLQRTVNVKYEIQGAGTALTAAQRYEVAKLLPTGVVLFEHVGKANSAGNTPATLVVIGLTESVYATVRGATFRNPVTLEESAYAALHPELRAIVSGWLKAKEVIATEKRVPLSETIAPVPLRVYISGEFSELRHIMASDGTSSSVASFLVGDSAFGVPYFRAINNGFLEGSTLSTILKSRLRNESSSSLEGAVAEYGRYMTLLTKAEAMRAEANNAAVVTGMSATSFFARMPRFLQIMTLKRPLESAIKDAVHAELAQPSAEPTVARQCVGGHLEWKPATLLKPTWCGVCNEYIWTMKAMHCRGCGIKAHQGCAEKMP